MVKSGAQVLREDNKGFADDVEFLRLKGKLADLRAVLQETRGRDRSNKIKMLEQVKPFSKVFGVNSFSDCGDLEALSKNLASIKAKGSTSTAQAYLAWLCHYHGQEGGPAEQFYADVGLAKKTGLRIRDFVGDPSEAYRREALPRTPSAANESASKGRLPREERDWEIALHRISAERRQRTGYLSLGKLRITSVPEAVFDLPWLERLNLSGTQIAHLWKPWRLEKLILLDISYSPMSSLESISACPSLTTLFCGETAISDLSPLAAIPSLQTIYCGSSDVRSLEPLSKLPKLTILHCEDTQITSLAGLENATELQVLDCQDTDISSVNELRGCVSLRQLILNGCRIAHRSDDIWRLPNLDEVIFARGELADVRKRVLSLDPNENCLPRLINLVNHKPQSAS